MARRSPHPFRPRGRLQRADPRDGTTDRRRSELEEPAARRRQHVEPGEDRRLTVSGRLAGTSPPRRRFAGPGRARRPIGDLAGIERLPSARASDARTRSGPGSTGPRRAWRPRSRRAVRGPATRSCAGRRPSPAPVEQLRPGEGDHEHGDIAGRLEDELDQVEQAVARPVQILDTRTSAGAGPRRSDRPTPGGEQRRDRRAPETRRDRRREQLGGPSADSSPASTSQRRISVRIVSGSASGDSSRRSNSSARIGQ